MGISLADEVKKAAQSLPSKVILAPLSEEIIEFFNKVKVMGYDPRMAILSAQTPETRRSYLQSLNQRHD